MCVLSHPVVPNFATPWTATLQAPLSMGISRQEYWSGLPCPSPGGLPKPGIELVPLRSPALAGRLFTISATRKAQTLEQPCSILFNPAFSSLNLMME